MEYIPIQCKSAIRKVRGGMPYQHDVNIYRGCEHGCLYCYALYSHDYLDDEKFYDHIYYKENIVEILEKEITPKERVRMARSFILNPEQNKGEVTGK